MGNSYAGQLRTTRFEEVLHNSIEASLRSNTVVPRPVFSQLYLEAKQSTLHNGRVENENEEEEDGSESNSPPVPYKMKPTPEGCCTTDGFCQAGRDLRLSSLVSEPQDVPPGFQLVGALSAGTPDTLLVCAVDRRFLPDERECNALLGFSGNCIGCGEKGFRYFTEFSNHINLKLSTQPKKQKHLKYHLYRNNQGQLVRGAAICWKGLESRGRQTTQPNASDGHVTSDDHFPNPAVTAHPAHTPGNYTASFPLEPIAPPPLGNGSHIPLSQNPLPQTPILSKGPGRPTVIGTLNTGPLKKRHRGWSPAGAESAVKTPLSSSSSSSSLTNWTKPDNAPAVSLSQGSSNSPSPPGPSVTVPDQLLHTCRLQPIIFSGHGSLPRLSGKVSDVQVSSLLQSCYQNCQALPRVYQHYGPSPIQPLSVEMQILLTVYYLVQLGPDQVLLIEDLEQIFMRSWRESHLSEIHQYQQPQPGLSLPQAPYTLPGLPLPQAQLGLSLPQAPYTLPGLPLPQAQPGLSLPQVPYTLPGLPLPQAQPGLSLPQVPYTLPGLPLPQAQPGLSLPQAPYTLPGLPLPQAQSLTPSQLPWLANLAASSCGEGVVVLGEKVSMALGLSDTFSRLMEGQLAHTNYVVIICTGKGQETESCMVVTGQHQCRALTEGMFSLSDSLREISQQLSSGMTQELTTFCNSLGPEGDVDVLLESAAVENRSQLTPLSISQECTKDSRPVDRQTDRATGIPKEPARDTHTDRAESPKDSCSEYRVEWREVRPIQLVVARKLLSHVCVEYRVEWREVRPIQLVVARKLLSHVCVEYRVEWREVRPIQLAVARKLLSHVCVEYRVEWREVRPIQLVVARKLLSHVCVEYRVEWREVRPIQLVVARKLLSHVCAIADSSTQNLDLGSFDRVLFLICVPPSEVTFQQTVLHLWNSGVLQNLGLEQDCLSQREAERYVVKMDQEARARIDDLIQEANRNPNTLFILVHDHAHWDISSGGYAASGGDSGSGLVDSLLNSCQIRDANNILILHVTSFPFALQTQHTRISPYNEIHWPSASNNEVDLYLEKTQYFGVCELLDSTRSGSGLPLLRYDSSFESMASVLEERFPKLHSAVIRTQVLIQHYCVAMMAVSGRSGSGGRSQHKHTSVETLEIVQSLLSAAQRCPSHHGHMVLLRLPSLALAGWAHQQLVRIRQRLGLGELFEIILGNPSQTLSIGQSFTERIKTWLKIQETDWVPRTYLELEALPCILILSGADPLGESLPRSLKYCDLRVISSSYLQCTALEQELGLAAYLVRVESQGSQPHGHAPGLGSDLSESDSDKLHSTDNEEKEGGENTLKSDLPGLGHSAPSVPHPPSVLQPPRTFPDSIAADPLHPHTTPQGPHLPPNTQRRPSKSTSLVSSSPLPPSLLQGCSWAQGVSRPPSLLLPRGLYDIIKAPDGSGLPRCTSFLPHRSVTWASSFRPLLSKMMTCTEQSLYYRQWTIPQPHHMDSSNRPAKGRTDNFHPRRLLLSGPPQVGKTGAYLQFLGILSRMLIRLMEVDIYDEEDINFSGQLEHVQYQPTCASWPVTDTLRGIPFDYTIHDPKYEDISTIYCPGYYPNTDGIPRRQEDVYLRRRTARIKLSKYAAYNTYHHCEQCHQYTGFNPAYQMYELTLHAFTFSHLLLGEDIQLYFIIPKSKHHHFSFSQPGGQLESMRLPLTSDWNPDCIKSPIFTPTTGRHEHGLFNLYHAMDGAAHLHILVIKEYEMAVYKKYWPNHIMLVLPTIFNGAGLGAAHFLIKELSYNNLELERSRRVEGGGPPADVWPFIILSDDSCVMWNAVDLDSHSTSGPAERNVSLKQMLQHMEACPDLTQFGLCGIRKWSSHSPGQGSGGGARHREPFSRGHLHDFLLLNVDLTQGIQFNQNRFTCDDVDFTLRVHSAGLLICRFNNFSVMKKQISIGGYHTFIIKNKTTDVPTSVQPSRYICATDSKHPFLATPAQLLLEKYLQHSSLFPLSTCNYTHPILSVDCYLNLGPEVTVCFVSSRPRSINICTTGLLFSGLLLCFWDSFVTPGFLKNFHFLKGAVLCVICADRSSLRQTVVRLELEDEWRFRLSDEFQTANAKEDRPLFFLTGKHI
ncbi:protein GREB1-like [Oncorhynchus nerka]|uniref:protein GREB1-like n=1 Tax=Oncorhynchus nerka TaxID=8023 RepID=UPI0031B82BEB